jgi:sugar/nucleoside kinase (ribokinase family)
VPVPGVLCAGSIVLDVLARPVDEVPWNRTVWIDSLEPSLGGNGANTSYTLAMLGVRARLLGMVGRDAFGEAALSTLRAAGVDLSRVGRSLSPTSATSVLVRSDGARALLHRPGSSTEAFTSPIEFTEELIAGCRRFHLANAFGLPKLRPHTGETLRRARLADLTTSLDTGWDACGEWMRVIGPCLPHVDLLFVNEDESRMLSGTADHEQAARLFLDRGAGVVVVKLGGAGCAVFTAARAIRVPAFDAPAIDSTGAGDCFAGGFLAALEGGETLEEAARFANAVGALSISSLGATTGIRSRQETLAWMAGARLR